MPKIAIFLLYQIFSNKNGLIADNNAHLLVLISKDCNKIVVYPKCPKFSKKLSASNVCMLATFSMSVQDHSAPFFILQISQSPETTPNMGSLMVDWVCNEVYLLVSWCCIHLSQNKLFDLCSCSLRNNDD